MTINIKTFSFTCGVFWGISVFLLTWWMIILGTAHGETILFERLYLGYTLTPAGSVIGLCWGFADGLIAGILFGWLSNLIHSPTLTKTTIVLNTLREVFSPPKWNPRGTALNMGLIHPGG